jgi:hypothetical protein
MSSFRLSKLYITGGAITTDFHHPLADVNKRPIWSESGMADVRLQHFGFRMIVMEKLR